MQLSDILADPALADTLSREEIFRLLDQCDGIRNTLSRALAGAPAPNQQSAPEDQLLDVNEAAVLLGMSEKWVRRNQAGLGSMKFGTRVKFSKKAIEAYKSRHRNGFPTKRVRNVSET